MTGTDVARFTHKSSRSYLNHLVSAYCCICWIFTHIERIQIWVNFWGYEVCGMELWPFEGNVACAWTQGSWNENWPSPKAIRIIFAVDGIDLKWSVSECACCLQRRFWLVVRLMIRLIGFCNYRQTFLEPLIQDFYWLGVHCLRAWERKRRNNKRGNRRMKRRRERQHG